MTNRANKKKTIFLFLFSLVLFFSVIGIGVFDCSHNTASASSLFLATPVLSYDASTNTLNWRADAAASKYRIYLNGNLHTSVYTNSYSPTVEGAYQVSTFVSVSIVSNLSNSVEVKFASDPVQLTAPTLEYVSEHSLLSWTTVSNASGYELQNVNTGDIVYSGSSTQYSYTATTSSTTFQVRAVGDGSSYLTSDWSKSVTVWTPGSGSGSDPSLPTTLSAPVLSYDSSQNLLSWTVTNDGGDYQLYNETTGSIATETMLTDFYPSESGLYKVKALGDGDSTEDSAWSNTVSVTVPESLLPSPTLNLSGKTLAWTPSGTGITYEVNNVTTGDTYTTQSLTFTVSVLGIYRVRALGDPGSGWSNTVFVDISSASDRYGIGYNDGYAAGLADGMLKASEGGGLRDLFLSIGDVPLHVIDGLLGGAALEDVFGFNLKATFLTILVVLIIALLVRKFVGL